MSSFIDLWHSRLETVTGQTGTTNDLYKIFLLERLGSVDGLNADIANMENLWLANETGLEGGNKYLWRKYLEAKGYSGAVPDMQYAAVQANNIFTDSGVIINYLLVEHGAAIGDEDYYLTEAGDFIIQQ